MPNSSAFFNLFSFRMDRHIRDINRDIVRLQAVPGHSVQDIVNGAGNAFVFWQLKVLLSQNVRYEHDSYGPLSDYLHALFPSSRHFSVVPQGILRPIVPGPDFSDVSVQGQSGNSNIGHEKPNVVGLLWRVSSLSQHA